MPASAAPIIQPGRVIRTRDLRRWGTNPARLAKRLVREGMLERLGHGIFLRPKTGRFGRVPPDEMSLLRAFLDDTPFVITGSDRWNALGLGATAVLAATLVYNTKRSGRFVFGGRPYLLRRVRFPLRPGIEWFVTDLIEHADMAGAARAEIERLLGIALAGRRFDAGRLREAAAEYGTRATRALIDRATAAARSAA